MIVTSRKEVYYKVEMTANQAADLSEFLSTMQERHIDEICKMMDCDGVQRNDVHETISALLDALESR